jgi:S-adenosylmethionine:tRNA ribosyltransferase-isomerase
MVVHRETGTIEHRTFTDLPAYVAAGDVLVRNTTRVFRARLLGTRDSGAPAEIFLLKPLEDDCWEAMVNPGAKLKVGRVVHIAPGFDAHIDSITERGTRVVRLSGPEPIAALIERHGHIPLPPYITRADAESDAERYQTVYARESGSVAAPTAGLHFTPAVIAAVEGRGATFADVLLHVGAGTFKPVEVESLAEHVMHEEWYRVPSATARAGNAARASGHRVWAIGTTSLRTLESVVDANGVIHAGEGETRIFIHPPHVVRGADVLLTNFHLPRSTLLMLVSAFAGTPLIREAYAAAVQERYRFFSYGDAMVIL